MTNSGQQRDAEPAQHAVCRLARARCRTIQAAGADQHADERNAHRDFVADDLRGRTHRAEERVFGIRRPAGEDDAVHAHRGHREQIQQTRVDVGEHGFLSNGITAHAANAGASAISGARTNSNLLDFAGTRYSLNSSLNTSANVCSQARRADAVRSHAHVHPAEHLALPPHVQRDGENHRHGDAQNADDQPHEQADHAETEQPFRGMEIDTRSGPRHGHDGAGRRQRAGFRPGRFDPRAHPRGTRA